MASEEDRIRVVVIGDNRVGKSAILNRFLNNTFLVRTCNSYFIIYTTFYPFYQSDYRPTVEDLYSKDFKLGSNTLKVDFLDTAGDDQVISKVCYLTLLSSDSLI